MNTERGLSRSHEEWLERRGLDPERAGAMGLFSAKLPPRGRNDDEPRWQEPVPDRAGNILVFPYFDGGEEVNAKFRAPGKRFYQRPGCRKTFWNADVLDDAALHDGRASLVITEGELDALAVIEAGHPWVVSCPDGAPADRDAKGRPIPMKPDAELDPENDPKFSFILNNWERLAKVKRIILATDGDGPGLRLRDELARRLGRVRCYFVEYPPEPVVTPEDPKPPRGCKDLNEVLIYHGRSETLRLIQKAKPYPVAGLYKLSDYERRPPITTYEVGFDQLNPLIRLYPGAFVVCSGLPGSGKSALVDQIAFNMAVHHGWPVTMATFEEEVTPWMRDKLTNFVLGRGRATWTSEDRREADAWIENWISFITDDPRGVGNEERSSVEWLIQRATDAVLRYGTKLLIVDPWNEVDHVRLPGENSADYLNRALRLLKQFAKQFSVAVVVVAHPTKSGAKHASEGDGMDLYDISDGSAWANKAELGVIVTRQPGTLSRVDIRKVKFHNTGELGHAILNFDKETRSFT